MSVCYFSLLNFLYGVNNHKITQVNKVQGKKEICSNQGNKLPKTTCRNYSSYTRPKTSLSISFPCQISSSRNFSLDGTCSKLVEKEISFSAPPTNFSQRPHLFDTSFTHFSLLYDNEQFYVECFSSESLLREYARKGKNKK